MTYSAMASKHPMRRAVTTDPDLYTVFGSGFTMGTPDLITSTMVEVPITGTDAVTGYIMTTDVVTAYGTGSDMRIQSIAENAYAGADDAAKLATYETKFSHSLAAGATPLVKGARQLTLQCDVRDTIGTSNPQTHLDIQLTAANALANPIEAQYYEIDFIVPADLDLQTGDTGTGKFFVTPFEFKTGGWYDTNTSSYKQAVGDFRCKIQITGTSGVNVWTAVMDNEANGRGIIPSLCVDGEIGNSVPVDKYIEVFNPDEPVLTGIRTTAKIYFRRPSGVDDLVSGRLKITIKPHGYEAFTLIDQSGGQMCGQENLPITRIYFGLDYTSANLPNPTILESLAVYNNPSESLLNSLFR